MRQAQKYEEIEPLLKLCKAGRLFDVQNWIAEGKPINPSSEIDKKRGKKSPLQVSMDTGFHSLVEQLLKSGASLEEPGYCPLQHALRKRRFDLIELLVNHGKNIHSVDMNMVFETWDPQIIEYLIEKGGDLKNGNPLAEALCNRIRTALGVFKRYEHKFPFLKEQVDIALRYHCKEGNLKWVSLMLWAGGNPYLKGPDSPYYDDPEEYVSALELAALYGHTDVFKLKNIKLDPSNEIAGDLLRNCCFSDDCHFLKTLLEKGYDPRQMEDKGSSLIQSLIYSMTLDFNPYTYTRNQKDIDTSRSRRKVEMIHMLVRHGAQWQPENDGTVNDTRRSFLKMKDDYVMEFVWIMSEYQACTRHSVERLMKTPSIRSLISKHTARYNELLENFN